MLEVTAYMAAFVVLSGLMAIIEAAVLSVSRGEVEELVLRKAFGAVALRAITERVTQAMVVLVVFTNTVNILGPILAGRKAMQIYGDTSIAVVTATLTLATIVFSEIIPKSMGSHYAPHISRLAAPTIQSLIYVLYPVVVALERFSSLFKAGERTIGTEAQIRSLAKIGRQAGHIETNERQLIQRAFVLNDRTAGDIMTPADRMIAFNETAPIREAASHIFRHEYSRYPVYADSMDRITGLVMARDILKAMTEGRDQAAVSSLCRACPEVPAEMSSDELLVRFRDEHVHLAIVREAGRTVGLVTLEDVLEELVGEIEDEKDAPASEGPPSRTSI